MWVNWNSYTLFVGMQKGIATIENTMEYFQKLKLQLSFDPAIPLLNTYSKELKLNTEVLELPCYCNNIHSSQDVKTT